MPAKWKKKTNKLHYKQSKLKNEQFERLMLIDDREDYFTDMNVFKAKLWPEFLSDVNCNRN